MVNFRTVRYLQTRVIKLSMDYPDNTFLEALGKINYEPQLKSQLLENLNKWNEKRGFALVKYNREYVKILLELLLLEDKHISRQVRGEEEDGSNVF